MASQTSYVSYFFPAFPPTPTTDDESRAEKLVRTFANMVGKSNKFDFTNRNIGGVKLGVVIAETFRKEVDKAQKDHDRQEAKAHKQRLEGASAPADPGKDLGIRIIDFKAPSKALGDEGILAMVPGLYTAISSGSAEAFLCLEDVNLSGNGLTAIALGDLGRVITVALHDLKTLNLSANKVVVHNHKTAIPWEAFLRSFKACMKLRRLDLSGNKLGSKAFEIFAQVYEHEEHITPLRLGGESSVYSLEEDAQQHREAKQYALDVVQRGKKATAVERSMADARLLKRRCGLRSLPYLDFSDTGLDDPGALWLSFVLPQHYFPVQLIDGINAAPANTTVSIYQQIRSSTGLDWSNNEETLGRDGFQLLTYVEDIRKETLYDSANSSNPDLLDGELNLDDLAITSRTALVARPSITSLRDPNTTRKLSGRFVPNLTEAEVNAASLSQTRHRLQRQIIQLQGVHSVHLWSTALDLVILSRRVFVLERRLTARLRQPGVSLKDITNTHWTPRVSQFAHLKGKRRVETEEEREEREEREKKEKEKEGVEVKDVQEVKEERPKDKAEDRFTTVFPKPESAYRARYFNYQLARTRARHVREDSMTGVVPFAVFKMILYYFRDDDEMNQLTEAQQRAAFVFGQTRGTLTLEREWTKLNASAQVLKLLDHIGCLAYESIA